MSPFEQESSFLPFGTWSVLLHVGILVLLSFLHFSHDVKQIKPMVKVTLIEAPTPKPAEKEPEPQAPPMLQTQRQPQPLQSNPIPPPEPLSVPPKPVKIAEIVAQPPQSPSPPPVKRRILQDQRATDTLRLRDLTKVATRSTPSTVTNVHHSSMTIPVLSTIAALEGVSTRHLVPTSSPSTTQGDSEAKLRTLRAEGGGTSSKARVRLRRPINSRHLQRVYKMATKESGWEGKVFVQVTVGPDGKPEHVTMHQGSGYKNLDKAVIDEFKKASFYPEKDGNFPIRSVVVIPIKFIQRKG